MKRLQITQVTVPSVCFATAAAATTPILSTNTTIISTSVTAMFAVAYTVVTGATVAAISPLLLLYC